MCDWFYKKQGFWVIVILILTLGTPTFANDAQGWINNSLSLKIDDTFSLKFGNEIRHHQVTFKDGFLYNWQGGIAVNLSKKLYLAVSYKREDTQKSSFLLHENRYVFEGGWKTKLGKKFDFDCRFLAEIRSFEADGEENHLRFRLRLRLKTNITLGQLQFNPFIAIEPFADTKDDEINRYRFYVGTVFPLSKNVGWVVNYIRQGTRDKETIDILNTGLDIKF